MIYKISAERMSQSKLEDLAQTVEDEGLGYVINGGMDPVFTGHATLLVEAREEAAKAIVAIAHGMNGGAYCAAWEIPEENIEEYF